MRHQTFGLFYGSSSGADLENTVLAITAVGACA
jgi:hypothetical protein